MRKQIEFDRLAAIANTEQKRRWKEKATELGFTSEEYSLLQMFAAFPKFINGFFDEKKKSALLDILGTRLEESHELIVLIRKDWNNKKNAIHRVLLDLEFWPDGYNPPDKVVAAEYCKRFKQEKLCGDALNKLIDNIKHQRQELAKKFPAKGKDPAL